MPARPAPSRSRRARSRSPTAAASPLRPSTGWAARSSCTPTASASRAAEKYPRHRPAAATPATCAWRPTTSSCSTNGALRTSAPSSAGGDIVVAVGRRVLLTDSSITAEAGGVTPTDAGGNIDIDPEYVILSSSDIVARANAGNGGNIAIQAGFFIASGDSTLDASSTSGHRRRRAHRFAERDPGLGAAARGARRRRRSDCARLPAASRGATQHVDGGNAPQRGRRARRLSTEPAHRRRARSQRRSDLLGRGVSRRNARDGRSPRMGAPNQDLFPSDAHVPQRRIQPLQVVDVGRQHPACPRSRAHRTTDASMTSRVPASSAKAGPPRARVRRRAARPRPSPEPSSRASRVWRLPSRQTRPTTRRLALQDEARVAAHGQEMCDNCPIVALERDQRARVHREPAAHLRRRLCFLSPATPSAASAAAHSLSVRGPAAPAAVFDTRRYVTRVTKIRRAGVGPTSAAATPVALQCARRIATRKTMNRLLRTSRFLPGLLAALAWTAHRATAQTEAEATYIVQSASLDSARTHVRRVGAEPERDLDIIHAVAVRLTAAQLARLRARLRRPRLRRSRSPHARHAARRGAATSSTGSTRRSRKTRSSRPCRRS